MLGCQGATRQQVRRPACPRRGPAWPGKACGRRAPATPRVQNTQGNGKSKTGLRAASGVCRPLRRGDPGARCPRRDPGPRAAPRSAPKRARAAGTRGPLCADRRPAGFCAAGPLRASAEHAPPLDCARRPCRISAGPAAAAEQDARHSIHQPSSCGPRRRARLGRFAPGTAVALAPGLAQHPKRAPRPRGPWRYHWAPSYAGPLITPVSCAPV